MTQMAHASSSSSLPPNCFHAPVEQRTTADSGSGISTSRATALLNVETSTSTTPAQRVRLVPALAETSRSFRLQFSQKTNSKLPTHAPYSHHLYIKYSNRPSQSSIITISHLPNKVPYSSRIPTSRLANTHPTTTKPRLAAQIHEQENFRTHRQPPADPHSSRTTTPPRRTMKCELPNPRVRV
ncbi:hypothetical protein M758_11G040100 [Ceratodon purpureus]|nr:hypothetical protein M758_11G040100 [Ceratodon purpureus]